jgi:hypothetical protein
MDPGLRRDDDKRNGCWKEQCRLSAPTTGCASRRHSASPICSHCDCARTRTDPSATSPALPQASPSDGRNSGWKWRADNLVRIVIARSKVTKQSPSDGDQPGYCLSFLVTAPGEASLRPSRRPLRGLLRMTFFLNAIIDLRHPEERCGAARLEGRTGVGAVLSETLPQPAGDCFAPLAMTAWGKR